MAVYKTWELGVGNLAGLAIMTIQTWVENASLDFFPSNAFGSFTRILGLGGGAGGGWVGWRGVDSQSIREDDVFYLVGLVIQEIEKKLSFQAVVAYPKFNE